MALRIACTVARLGSVEVGVGVVVSDGVVEGVGGDLVRVHLGDSVGNGVGNSVGNHRGVVDHRGGMDQGCGMGHSMAKTVSDNAVGKTVVGNRVGESRGSVGNYWSGVGNSMVGNWVSHMGSQGNNSSVSDRDRPVGSDGRLDLREALGVVRLSD